VVGAGRDGGSVSSRRTSYVAPQSRVVVVVFFHIRRRAGISEQTHANTPLKTEVGRRNG
jgi:hypothetical protein